MTFTTSQATCDGAAETGTAAAAAAAAVLQLLLLIFHAEFRHKSGCGKGWAVHAGGGENDQAFFDCFF